MSLLDEIEASTRRPGTDCGVAKILARLDDADAADLRAALVTATTPGSAIARALRARGFTFRDDTITRHRRRECSCR